MQDDNYKSLADQVVNVRLDIRELSTKVDGLKEIKKEVEEARSNAKEALNYAKSGQHQINDLKDAQKWLWRTAGSALIAGAIGLLWKAIGG